MKSAIQIVAMIRKALNDFLSMARFCVRTVFHFISVAINLISGSRMVKVKLLIPDQFFYCGERKSVLELF